MRFLDTKLGMFLFYVAEFLFAPLVITWYWIVETKFYDVWQRKKQAD